MGGLPHADGYSGFNGLFGDDKADEMACMAHVRRKFVDIFASQGNAIAEEAIRRIAELYAAEKEARGKSPDTSILPMGSLYEGAMFMLFEIMVLRLRDLIGVDPDAMRRRHTNME